MTHELSHSGCSPFRGHLTGGYVTSPSATPKFTYGKLTSHIPRTLGVSRWHHGVN